MIGRKWQWLEGNSYQIIMQEKKIGNRLWNEQQVFALWKGDRWGSWEKKFRYFSPLFFQSFVVVFNFFFWKNQYSFQISYNKHTQVRMLPVTKQEFLCFFSNPNPTSTLHLYFTKTTPPYTQVTGVLYFHWNFLFLIQRGPHKTNPISQTKPFTF